MPHPLALGLPGAFEMLLLLSFVLFWGAVIGAVVLLLRRNGTLPRRPR